jgi:hypothetical protein
MAARPRWLRLAALGLSVIVAVAIVLTVLALSGRSNDGLATTGSPTPFPSPPHAAAMPTRPGPTLPATAVGSPQRLTGQYPGEQITVTAIKLVPNTQSFGNFAAPGPNERYAAVQFDIINTGDVNYTDSATAAAALVDSLGRPHPAVIVGAATAGVQIPASVTLTPGERVRGYVVFTVPKTAHVMWVRYAMDAGYGETGQWLVEDRD